MTRGIGRREGEYWRHDGGGQRDTSSLGPNIASMLYAWEPTADNITLNGADAVSILCRDANGAVVVGNELVQNTGARQALWNLTDADFGNQPTIEFAGAEQYTTTNAITLPTAVTVVCVAQDQNAAAFASIFEHSPFYSSADGGLVYYSSTTLNAGLNYTSQTIKSTPVPGGGAAGRFVWVTSFDLSIAGAGAIPLARVNNAAMGATGFNASAIGTFRSAQLMCGGRAASTFWTGPWALTRVYTGTFTGAQADAEYAYMKGRFGLP